MDAPEPPASPISIRWPLRLRSSLHPRGNARISEDRREQLHIGGQIRHNGFLDP